MKSSELLAQISPGELLLGVTEDGLPVKLNIEKGIGPIYVIAGSESKTHDLLILAATSCRQSSPNWQLTVVTEKPSAWQKISLDFVTTPGDPRLTERFNKMINQTDARHLLIVEGLEYGDQMPTVAQTYLNALRKNDNNDGVCQLITSVNPDKIPGGIDQLLTTYYGGQLIFGKASIGGVREFRPNEFSAAGMNNGQPLKFFLPEI